MIQCNGLVSFRGKANPGPLTPISDLQYDGSGSQSTRPGFPSEGRGHAAWRVLNRAAFHDRPAFAPLPAPETTFRPARRVGRVLDGTVTPVRSPGVGP